MAEKQELRAGPLRLWFSSGDLRRICLGEREVLRRVYVAVRDRNWGTVAGKLENLSVMRQERHFSITYDATHREGDIDFRWRATILGTEAGKITFAMDGKAHASFLRNRIGFCVHHPLKECAGRPCVVEKTNGRRERGVFPEYVSPHQPFLDLAAITHEVMGGVEAEVRFHGEVFETEDHRNWTDANFKTYGTPLALPFPVEVKEGTEIHQMVELTLRGSCQKVSPAGGGTVTIRMAERPSEKLPALGLGLARDERGLTANEVERLKRLRLSHLRVDAGPGGSPVPLLQRAAEQARVLGVKLEAALTWPLPFEGLAAFAPLVERWLVFDAAAKATTPQAIEAARTALGPAAVIVAGTNFYFAELNRNRPQGGGWDAACFSVNPQVHAFDDESVMENVAAQYDAIRSARRFLANRRVIVSPVTLRPRFNPDATSASAAPVPDPRQKLPFCAAWTVGSLKNLAEAGAHSVTYFQTRGAGGLLEGDITYPVYRVFEAVADFAGGEVIPSESSDPLRVAALGLAAGTRRRLLAANVTNVRQRVRVEERRRALVVAPYGVQIIDWKAD